MADLIETITYEAGIYQLERTDLVDAGVNGDGVANRQASQLANRTAWLKQQVDFIRLPTLSEIATVTWFMWRYAPTYPEFLQVVAYQALTSSNMIGNGRLNRYFSPISQGTIDLVVVPWLISSGIIQNSTELTRIPSSNPPLYYEPTTALDWSGDTLLALGKSLTPTVGNLNALVPMAMMFKGTQVPIAEIPGQAKSLLLVGGWTIKEEDFLISDNPKLEALRQLPR